MGKSRDAQVLPYSYAALSDGPRSEENHHLSARPWKRQIFGVFCVFLLVASFVAFQCYEDSSNNENNAHTHNVDDDSTLSKDQHEWRPVSRGVSAGVSEKSNNYNNNMLLGSSASESFPWNNTMLSWQRTAFHFQPEKNWMNGN